MRPSSADRILLELKTRGPQDAGAIARTLSVTPMAVRQQLYKLRCQGLVGYRDERRPVGRPARIWNLTGQAQVRFPDSHAQLTTEMLAAIRAIFGDTGVCRILAERSRGQTESYRERLCKADGNAGKRLSELARIRSEQGYMAEVSRRRDGSFLLVENNCPIGSAAGAWPEICREELALFRNVLGKGVTVERLEHAAEGERRCAYRVSAGTR